MSSFVLILMVRWRMERGWTGSLQPKRERAWVWGSAEVERERGLIEARVDGEIMLAIRGGLSERNQVRVRRRW